MRHPAQDAVFARGGEDRRAECGHGCERAGAPGEVALLDREAARDAGLGRLAVGIVEHVVGDPSTDQIAALDAALREGLERLVRRLVFDDVDKDDVRGEQVAGVDPDLVRRSGERRMTFGRPFSPSVNGMPAEDLIAVVPGAIRVRHRRRPWGASPPSSVARSALKAVSSDNGVRWGEDGKAHRCRSPISTQGTIFRWSHPTAPVLRPKRSATDVNERSSIVAGYILGNVDVLDPEGYKEYTAQVPGTLAPYGGKFIGSRRRQRDPGGRLGAAPDRPARVPERRAGKGLVRLARVPGDHPAPAEIRPNPLHLGHRGMDAAVGVKGIRVHHAVRDGTGSARSSAANLAFSLRM